MPGTWRRYRNYVNENVYTFVNATSVIGNNETTQTRIAAKAHLPPIHGGNHVQQHGESSFDTGSDHASAHASGRNSVHDNDGRIADNLLAIPDIAGGNNKNSSMPGFGNWVHEDMSGPGRLAIFDPEIKKMVNCRHMGNTTFSRFANGPWDINARNPSDLPKLFGTCIMSWRTNVILRMRI